MQRLLLGLDGGNPFLTMLRGRRQRSAINARLCLVQWMELPHTSSLIGHAVSAVSPWHDDTHGQTSQQETDSMFSNHFSIAAEHQLQVAECGGR